MLTLITGGAGFLGSHLASALVDAGSTVVVIDNLSSGHVRNLEHAISSGRATFVYGDVAGPTSDVRALVDRVVGTAKLDRIYHLASPASPEAYGANPWETLAVNGLGTMSLVEVALERKARLLYTSTSEIYGDPLVHPQPEGYFGNVDPIGPRSCYDEGKRFAEAVMATAVRARGLEGRIVRFFNCYGPMMDQGDGRLVPNLIDAIMKGEPLPIHGSGQQTRSMTYVDDAIRLLREVMERPQPTLQPINIGNDDERSVEEIARTLAKIAGIEFNPVYLPGREQDPQRRCPNIDLARGYGWSPATQLEEGLLRTYRWFKDERLAYA
ncbi:MAG: GDP-mannose 4,6-dehydratase [Vulcanimicrobiaceae bacterium]